MRSLLGFALAVLPLAQGLGRNEIPLLEQQALYTEIHSLEADAKEQECKPAELFCKTLESGPGVSRTANLLSRRLLATRSTNGPNFATSPFLSSLFPS